MHILPGILQTQTGKQLRCLRARRCLRPEPAHTHHLPAVPSSEMPHGRHAPSGISRTCHAARHLPRHPRLPIRHPFHSPLTDSARLGDASLPRLSYSQSPQKHCDMLRLRAQGSPVLRRTHTGTSTGFARLALRKLPASHAVHRKHRRHTSYSRDGAGGLRRGSR